LVSAVAAVSVGIVKGQPVLDLDYAEDSTAFVDCNVIGTSDEALVEVQATAEGKPFSRAALTSLLDLADLGLAELFAAQREAIRIATTAR
jgi:ribonuclease PH